ncbi:MAG: nickel pincer cofactor biosynthesis protein LarC, partial [Erysipelotrichaceae bacterium]|nr:nickel pincer cofactor biosynthesis protein LarC [Erysipelotrichaceae bacterium]
ESKVHGVEMDQIHFHELGTMDALADVSAVCYMMDKLGVDEVVCSPVHVGSGTVKCAHGVLPVPAPATANILKGIPCYSEQIRGELCTPTGAALLKHFVSRFGDMPMMSFEKVGYGMGKKDFERANCVRVILGEGEDRSETVYELSLNVDDMSAEKIGFACERLFEAGALDVYTEAIGMKKGRPGTLIRVMYRDDSRDAILKAVFRHTTTIGCREIEVRRYVLDRRIETVETSFGPVRKKVVSGYGVERFKYEYEDLARIAEEKGISIDEVIEKL